MVIETTRTSGRSNFTPIQIHHSLDSIKTEKLRKNNYRKNVTPVNQLQD